MWNKKSKIIYIIYKFTASWFPETRHFPLGGKMRYLLAKKIMRYCGRNVNIERNAAFTPEVKIGDNSGIGIKSEIYGEVTIGMDVMMGPEVVVYTENHNHASGIRFIDQGHSDPEPVEIGDNVWIGRRAMFMPGSGVGNNSVVAAGSVVTKKFPSNSLIGGNPAKLIKKIM